MKKKSQELNEVQKLALASYESGDYSGIENLSELEHCGDQLIIFVINELADVSRGSEAPYKDSLSAIEVAIKQLKDIACAFERKIVESEEEENSTMQLKVN